MPPNSNENISPNRGNNEIEHPDLNILFETEDTDGEFFGFDISSENNLNRLFETEDTDGEFFGFDISSLNDQNNISTELRHLFTNSSNELGIFHEFMNTSRSSDLTSLFLNESNDSEFFGF